MAISDATKIVVMQLKNRLKGELEQNQNYILEHQATIDTLKARNVALKAQLDALKADIADPPTLPVGP